MNASPCITLTSRDGHPLKVSAQLPEWLSVHVFTQDGGVRLCNVLVTERCPDTARAMEVAPLRVDGICEASERDAVMEAAVDALEHVLAGLSPSDAPRLDWEHPDYNSPAHRRARTLDGIAALYVAEQAVASAFTAVQWSAGAGPMGNDASRRMLFERSTRHSEPKKSHAVAVMAEWIRCLAEETCRISHDKAEAARERWEASHPTPRAVTRAASRDMDCRRGVL